MATGDMTIMPKFIQSQADGSTLASVVDFDTDTIKVVVLLATFTPDTTASSAQEHFDDISASEVATATAYTGPITLASKTLTLSGAVVTFDAADISIGVDGSGFTTARYIAVYKDSGTPSTSPIIAIGDLGANKSNVSATVEFNWASGGILTWTRS